MKKFCEYSGEHVMDIINFKNKRMKLLTKEQQELYAKRQKFAMFIMKVEDKYAGYKKCRKVRDHCHYTGEYRSAAHRICNLK